MAVKPLTENFKAFSFPDDMPWTFVHFVVASITIDNNALALYVFASASELEHSIVARFNSSCSLVENRWLCVFFLFCYFEFGIY